MKKKQHEVNGKEDFEGNHSCLKACCVSGTDQVTLKCGHQLNVIQMACESEGQRQIPRMPTKEGYLSGKCVTVLRDTGCSTVVVRKDLINPDQLTGKSQSCVLVDGTVKTFPIAKVYIDTPYFTGSASCLCMENPVYDIVIGNIDGARDAKDPLLTWKAPPGSIPNLKTGSVDKSVDNKEYFEVSEVNAVETRAAARRKEKPIKPLLTPSPVSDVSSKELQEAQHSDPTLEMLWKKTKEPKQKGVRYIFIERNGFLLRENQKDVPYSSRRTQVVVPTKYRNSVMKIAHDGLMSGHQGIKRTTDKVMSQFYWPGISEDIKHYCRSCDICQRTVQKGKIGKVPLGRMPRIDIPFKRVAVDLVGPIVPVSDRGNRYILMLVDFATRYPEAVALPNIETETVADALVDIFSGVGVPQEMLSDMGAQFTSDVMKATSRLLSMKQINCTVYHAMCNGLVEKMNGVIKQMLKRMCTERPRDWDRYLKPLLFAYRECPHASMGGFSPFEVLNGRSMRGPLAILRELWTNEKVEPEVKTTYQYVLDLKNKLQYTCELVAEALEKSAEKYKKYYDKGKKVRRLQVGDKVLILLPTDKNKLMMQWKGPYQVVSRFNDNDYRVQVKDRVKSYHVNMLKKYVERGTSERAMGIFEVVIPDTEVRNDDLITFDQGCSMISENSESEPGFARLRPIAMPSSRQKE